MTYLLAGLLIGVLIAGWFGFERQRQVFEQMVQLLEQDREIARNEAKVFRGLLFPSITRAENGLVDAPKIPTRQSVTPVTADRRARPRMPFRKLFNEARKLNNTAQIKTDALADALKAAGIETKPVQEKTHVS